MNKIRTKEDPKILDQLRVNEVSTLYQVNSTVRIDDSFDTKSLRSFNNFEAEYGKEYTTEEGNPWHLAMCNIVTIVTPSGDVRTFYKNINVEIPWTDDTKRFPNGIRYPAIETYRYKELISKIKGAANTQFRQEQGNFIFSALGINTEN